MFPIYFLEALTLVNYLFPPLGERGILKGVGVGGILSFQLDGSGKVLLKSSPL